MVLCVKIIVKGFDFPDIATIPIPLEGTLAKERRLKNVGFYWIMKGAMDVMNIFGEYLRSLADLDVLNQNEHTGRTPLENLLNKLRPSNIQITHEGKRSKDGFGAPDFTVNHTEKHTVIGYIENKRINENLRKILKSEQIEKYRKLSENLILTDYLEWIWLYKDSEPVKVRLCNSEDLYNKKFRLSEEKVSELRDLIANFYAKEPDKIANAKVLAEKLSRPSIELRRYIKDQVNFQLRKENEAIRDELYAVYEIFRDGLFEELKPEEFADGFAQMLTYSIFLAKLNSSQTLSLQNTKDHIPQAFSLIKTLGKFLDLLSENKHKEIKWAIENILSVINNIDAFAIAESLGEKHGDEEKDPYIYFYEDFLEEYNPKLRKELGAYYTPPAVVQFIVNQVSNILEGDFSLSEGLANPKVKLLDFACGTGTFLFESYKKVLDGARANSFEQNVLIEHLLKNFFGFEIMISSYIISHLKLSQFLKEQGYDVSKKDNKRIGVYLTNTLENKKSFQPNLFAKAVAEEGKKASEIKGDKEIIAIVGNPPYNVSSQNVLHNENELLKFHGNYKPRDEKKLNIDDDYIKFIAFAHKKINDAGSGVVGIIVNNSFLKGLTHRKMRNELMKDFDKIYIIDLHGNARIGETAIDGSADQNVFNIMQGVCICLFVKNKGIKDKGVFHIDLYGKRKEKFRRLYELNREQLAKLEIEGFNKAFLSTKWGEGRFTDNPSFFAPMKQAKEVLEYGEFWGLTDIFNKFGSGVKTERDNITIHFTQNECKDVVNDLNSLAEHEIRKKYLYNPKTGKYHKDARDWQVLKAQKDVQENYNKDLYQKIAYRPFDTRRTFYTSKTRGFIGTPSNTIMQHMLKGDNVGLVFARNYYGQQDYDLMLVSGNIVDIHLIGGQTYFAPLYDYETNLGVESCEPNFKPEFAKMVAKKFGNPTPEEVLAFIYAQMHSPVYRTKYLELLKIDFPRVSFDVSPYEFKRLAGIGQELIDAHLMRKIPNLKIGSCISAIGFDNITCQKPRYDEAKGRIYVCDDIGKEVYFDGVSLEIWNFKIGGYQVLDKYLKERVERILTAEEIGNVTNIIRVLAFTIEIMKKIDENER